jgi:hypothetical protein
LDDDDDEDDEEHVDSYARTDDNDDDEIIENNDGNEEDEYEENEYNKENKGTFNSVADSIRLTKQKNKSSSLSKKSNKPKPTTTEHRRLYPNLNQIKQEIDSTTITSAYQSSNKFKYRDDDDDENDMRRDEDDDDENNDENEVKYSSQMHMDNQNFKLSTGLNNGANNRQRLVDAFFTASPSRQLMENDHNGDDDDENNDVGAVYNNQEYGDNVEMNDFYHPNNAGSNKMRMLFFNINLVASILSQSKS